MVHPCHKGVETNNQGWQIIQHFQYIICIHCVVSSLPDYRYHAATESTGAVLITVITGLCFFFQTTDIMQQPRARVQRGGEAGDARPTLGGVRAQPKETNTLRGGLRSGRTKGRTESKMTNINGSSTLNSLLFYVAFWNVTILNIMIHTPMVMFFLQEHNCVRELRALIQNQSGKISDLQQELVESKFSLSEQKREIQLLKVIQIIIRCVA